MRLFVLSTISALLVGACGGSPTESAMPPPMVIFGGVNAQEGVWMMPQYGEELSCARGDVLVRENVETHEIVRIAACDVPPYENFWHDTCAPVGVYHYGPAEPIVCAGKPRARVYYWELKVKEPIALDCATPHEPWTKATPWADTPDGRFTCP